MRGAAIAAAALAALVVGAASAASAGTPGFRTPSRNIACAAFATPKPFLRCDIFSGVKPEPTIRCDFDWVGYVVDLRGRGRALCGSDTVNGLNSHVLAYGKTWHALGFTCVSRSAGLRCTNPQRHGFFLSRAHSYGF